MTGAVEQKLADQAERILIKRIADNELELPSLPTAALKCMELFRLKDFAPKDAAATVEKDPVLAARIMRAANSAAHGGMEPAKSIPQALTRMGVDRLRSIVVEVSTSRLFESRDPRIMEATRGLWDHCVAVGLLSRDLAAIAGQEDAEGAYLAGLLHDVGKPVVAWMLLDLERTMMGSKPVGWIEHSVWVEVINLCHRKIGLALAKKWKLPESVITGIGDCSEYDSVERLSIANCVRFANALAKREKLYVGKVDQADVEALIMIGRSILGVDDTVLNRLCGGLAERVAASHA